jgi:TorA maturation chaperone TorD
MSPVGVAKARGSFYAFLGLHFLNLPDEAFVSGLRDSRFRGVLKELISGSEVHPEIAEGARLMDSYLERTENLKVAELAERLGKDRTRLYRGASFPKGPKPPYETLWLKPDPTEAALQEISAAYARSGFALKPTVHERVDYIGIELDFMEKLVADEISALEAGETGAVHTSVALEREFFCRHLGRWAPGFVVSGLELADTDFYKGHLHMLKGFLEQEEETLKPCS